MDYDWKKSTDIIGLAKKYICKFIIYKNNFVSLQLLNVALLEPFARDNGVKISKVSRLDINYCKEGLSYNGRI